MDVIQRIKDRGDFPTRQDISDVLESVGKPGKKREDKQAAVRLLFEKTTHRPTNGQGIHVVDTLETYEAY